VRRGFIGAEHRPARRLAQAADDGAVARREHNAESARRPPAYTSSVTLPFALRAALALVAVYVAVLGLIAWQQERLLFRPALLPASHRFDFGADVHERWVDVPGARLNLLHLRRPAPDGVVFFLHGNGGNLDSWFTNGDFYRAANLDLVMLDYRGYGKSSGRIASEAELMADVRAAWNAIAPAYAGKRRIVYGRSLGSALAAQLAAEVQPDLTVLVSPYASMGELAAEHYPWVPSVLLRYPLDTGAALARVQGTLLIAHGEQDTLIRVEHSRRLKARVPQATLVVVPGAGHGDIHQFSIYTDALRSAYRLRGAQARSAA
jgi:pimeloyl-ACP methyl ester carboxylesterase